MSDDVGEAGYGSWTYGCGILGAGVGVGVSSVDGVSSCVLYGYQVIWGVFWEHNYQCWLIRMEFL